MLRFPLSAISARKTHSSIGGITNNPQRTLHKTYYAHPELFGTTHLREIVEPAQLADIIGEEDFTIVSLRVVLAVADGKTQVGEVVATGSVKDFGDGDVEAHA